MVRTAILAWVFFSVPVSVLIGRMIAGPHRAVQPAVRPVGGWERGRLTRMPATVGTDHR